MIDRGTETTYAWVGEFVAIMAQQCGMAGIIIDGPATDKLALKRKLSGILHRFLPDYQHGNWYQ